MLFDSSAFPPFYHKFLNLTQPLLLYGNLHISVVIIIFIVTCLTRFIALIFYYLCLSLKCKVWLSSDAI